MLYRQYEPEVLKKVQRYEKQILKKFIDICDQYELKYFVAYGTLIGTIRHHGFIPWDDDIDVAMPRSDYEKFLEIAQKECGNEYFLQTPDTDPEYHLFFAKLRLKDTEFVENTLQKAGSVSGIYIDIMPYDYIPDDDALMKKQVSSAVKKGMLLSINRVKEPQIGQYGAVKTTMLKCIWKIGHYGMKVCHISGESIWNRCKKVSMMYDDVPTKRLCSFFAEPEKWIIYASEIENLIEMDFEDIKVKVPEGYDSVLTRGYGDYMTLPPVEQRINHMPMVLKFPNEEEIRY